MIRITSIQSARRGEKVDPRGWIPPSPVKFTLRRRSRSHLSASSSLIPRVTVPPESRAALKLDCRGNFVPSSKLVARVLALPPIGSDYFDRFLGPSSIVTKPFPTASGKGDSKDFLFPARSFRAYLANSESPLTWSNTKCNITSKTCDCGEKTF